MLNEHEIDHDGDIFRGVGVEVDLKSQDDFLKVRETLTRIGIASKKEKKLYLNYQNIQMKKLEI